MQRNQALIICLRLPCVSRSQLVDGQSQLLDEPPHIDDMVSSYSSLFHCTAFPRTLHHLFLHPPITVLVPDNALASSIVSRPGAKTYRSSNPSARDEPSLLVQCIEAKTGIQCRAVPRVHWNQGEGRFLHSLDSEACRDGSHGTLRRVYESSRVYHTG